ncbi:MAG TPA: DNA polymerase III subunit gamma/tau [Bacteroidetes bacterium]|nr:DNA polymerase III subunit gamma/tau [Candidatus Limimorpha avicola]
MDNFIVSARKYRPSTFDSVVGQGAITSTLKNAIKTNTLAQAFLFCGPRGVGKTTCARIMAKTINCTNRTEDFEACNECESCRSFNNSASFNVYELDAASNNSVDDIRNLVEQVRIPPQTGEYKVYIIDEVHMLSQAAFNAFLKTLEEPPAYAKFILATTEKHKIIPTILSRCQIFDFKRITVEDITKHLQNIAAKEGITVEEEALNIVAQKADGALRDALSIFDQMVSFSGKNITYHDVIANLNVLDYEYYFQMTDNILRSDYNAVLLLLDEVIDKGFDAQNFIQGLSTHFRNLLLGRNAAVADLMEVGQQLKQRYITQAKLAGEWFLLKSLDLANQCDIDFKSSNNKRLHLEICLLKMCYATQRQMTQQRQVQPQQQHVNPQQSAGQPQQIQPQQHVNPQQPIHSQQPAGQQQNVQPQQAQKYDDTKVSRSGSMFSVSISSTEKKEKEPEHKEIVMTNPFTVEQVQDLWQRFVSENKLRMSAFVAGIVRSKITLVAPFEIHFTIDNTLVVNDLQGMSALRDYLRKGLNNNQFTLIEHVEEQKHKEVPYTDRSKFEKMAEKNPNLIDLRDKLNLDVY